MICYLLVQKIIDHVDFLLLFFVYFCFLLWLFWLFQRKSEWGYFWVLLLFYNLFLVI